MEEEYFAYSDAVLKHREKIERGVRRLIGVVPPKHAAILLKLLELCSEESFMAL